MKKLLLGVFISAFFIACNNEKNDDANGQTPAPAATGKKPPIELLADSALVAGVQSAMDAFEKADINGYTANYDDNMRFYWSGGDSLIGKKAIIDYYTNRFKIIESIKFSNRVFLPIMLNESQYERPQKGKWVLSWYMVDVKYKNGKSLKFWAHNTAHFNDAGKVDFGSQYIDRHPIMEATKDLVK